MKVPAVDDKNLETGEIQETLIELQRLAGIGTLTAGVAHELTNPINVITATCNNLLSQLADENLGIDELLHYVEMIDQSAWRCARLIRTLRDYTYLNGQHFASRNLNRIGESAIVLVSYEFERQYNLEIKTDLERDLEDIICDQNQITQVMINLLVNARDAMLNDGGKIVLSTWSIPEKNAQAFSVTDEGTGVDPAVMPIIFEPFVTTKPMGKGTGLGLAIASQIVEDHHGTIEVTDNPRGGAIFTVTIPCQQPD